MYLMRYGYMDQMSSGSGQTANLLSPDALKDSILEFQRFAGLEETGEMDAETERMMSMPRCGVKDIVGHGATTRKKRYALQGSRWRVKDLTYKVSKYPTTRRLNKEDVDEEIATALRVWSEHTDLTFTKKDSGRVNTLTFASRNANTATETPSMVRAGLWPMPFFPSLEATPTLTMTRGGQRVRFRARICCKRPRMSLDTRWGSRTVI